MIVDTKITMSVSTCGMYDVDGVGVAEADIVTLAVTVADDDQVAVTDGDVETEGVIVTVTDTDGL